MRASEDQRTAYIAMLKNDYTSFTLHVNNGGIIDNAIRWIPGKMHKYLCSEIDKFLKEETGEAYDVLCISCPPQHGKSMCVTEVVGAYYICCINPDGQVMLVSYGDTLSKRFGRKNRSIIQKHGGMFGLKIDSTSKSQTDFRIKGKEGRVISRGIGGVITGERSNLLVIDDPIKNREEADSPVYRAKLLDEWKSTLSTRIAPGGKVILIMTRWHEDDLFSTLAKEEGTKVINLPCEAEERDLLGRKEGEALCPEIGKDNKWLKSYKNKLITGLDSIEGESGQRAWNALFQGRPSQKEGNIFKRGSWQFYTSGEIDYTRCIMTVDCSFKGAETSDFVAIGVFTRLLHNFYLIDIINKKLGFVETVNEIIRVKSLYPKTSAILVEDKANGTAVIDVLKRRIPGIIGVNPRGGKVARATSISDLQEAGNIYLPRDNPIIGEFIDQCSDFPNAKNDDMVDVLSMGIERLRYMPDNRITTGMRRNMPHYNISSVGGKGGKIFVT